MLQSIKPRAFALYLVFLLSMGWLCPSIGSAGESAAVLPIEASASQDTRLTSTITASMRRALARFDNLEDRGLLDFSLAEAKMSFNCADERASCMATIGATVEVSTLFWGHIRRTHGGLKLSLRGVDVGSRQIRYSIDVVLRDAFDLEQKIDDIAHAFLSGEEYNRVRQTALRLRSTPSGAEVRIDGRSYGPTPIEAVIPSGRHLVELDLRGYRALREEITIDGPSETLRYSLERESAALAVRQTVPPPAEESSLGWNIWAGIGTGALSLGAITTGIVLHAEVYQLRQDELADKDDIERAEQELKRLEADMNVSEADKLTARQMYTAKYGEYQARREGRMDEFDSTVLPANIALGVGGLTAAVAIYLLFFHETEPDLSVSTDGVGVGFSF